MKQVLLKFALYLLAILFSVTFFSACEEPSDVGLEVQPGGDKLDVIYCDTISLVTYTVLEDSLRTDETAYNLLGSYFDPIFGRHTAGFYTQVRLSSNAPSFGNAPVLDSIVLSLAYQSYYGDTLAPQSVKVYRVNENFYKDSSYYSNQELQITGELLGSKTFYPLPTDSVYVGTDTLGAQLRIRINPVIGQDIMNAAGSDLLADNTNFLEYFKGLYVTSMPVGNSGCIMSFNLLSNLSALTLYYKNDEDDSLKYTLSINENCARFNHFNHSNYLNANPFLRSEIYGDTAKGDSLLYLQGIAGLKIKIKYPYLLDFVKNGRIAVNKAELIIPVEDPDLTYEDFYPAPEKLILIEEKEGSIRFLLDQYEGAAYFGGAYDDTRMQYKFNIARHLQQVIDGAKENLGLSLIVYNTDRPSKANRVVLKGSKRHADNFRLVLTYTKLY